MESKKDTPHKLYGKLKGQYRQKGVKKRIEALFLDNIGKVVTREQIIKAATDPGTGQQPENWHQRLSELRTDDGYTILSWRNRGDLKVQEYLMPHTRKPSNAGKRVRPTDTAWLAVLKRANYSCEWNEAGIVCGLKNGEIDPVGGGRVKLTPDHKNPHSLHPDTDPEDPAQWWVRTKKETKYESYNYPLWGGPAQITLEYLIHIASGIEDKKVLSGFDCGSTKLCGVGIQSGGEVGPLTGKNVFIPFIENNEACMSH